ncbi:tRNA modification GTPase MnmE [Sulfuriferula plumbiphila]|uniref:tRNA modification GTPase MnmE n=1 Tax=Sulfuriferula plumbiphila TaxID=171865 RepID=A0A512L318_9PROT|nr:tRNA uridine-5-carboxymethylaminomethyl(34) synthesis GTPase MnmE [Sulfuriferula plumbiphila]BBP06073.1 tRNA modification GTPase MnmE [Sulfuriferula plumbiphila]GEP28870.1 tRNA modification GTPase MnmE [Sulfuriferula plumbiphila]
MASTDNDTIAAVATAPGRGGIGVVRISGKQLTLFAKAILGHEPKPRLARLCRFRDSQGDALDEGIALYFPAPHSFTGEDVLELQGHGGPAVLQLILSRCFELGARPAQPGEFTRRAYLNDKLDLAQAESVADLIDAASAEAARCALRSLTGVFSQRIHELVDALINLRMLVEATLDFPEEETDFLKAADAFGKLAAIQGALEKTRLGARQGSVLREGIRVVLIGQPNVGKSSLLNQLAGQDVAIVTAVPGTTRDTVRETIQIQGVPLHIIDTAGLRQTEDEVERIGIARTWEAIRQASVALLLVDVQHGVTAAEQDIIAALPGTLPLLTIHNKIDLGHETFCRRGNDLYLSAKTGEGIDILRTELLKIAGWQPEGEGLFMARDRHLIALAQAAQHIERARAAGGRLEFFAEELRLAQNALSTITGEFSADDLLGEIFSRFCIGK